MKSKENEKYIKLAVTSIAVIIIGLLCFFLFYRIRGFGAFFKDILNILKPFVYGFVIAYVLMPSCRWWEKRFNSLLAGTGLKRAKALARGLSITLCELMLIAIAGALLVLIIPQLCSSVLGIVSALPGQLDNANEWLHNLLDKYPDFQQYWDDFYADIAKRLSEWLNSDLTPFLQNILGGISDQVVNMISLVQNVFLGMIVSIYLLASRQKFKMQAKMLLFGCVPQKWADRICNEAVYADKMFSGFLMGKLLDSAIIGVICFICTTMMRIKSSLLVSVVVGVTNIIPFFGPFIGAVPSVLLLLLENPAHAVYFLGFIIILQQVDGNIIGPKILGNSTGVSSFWVLFSILFFGGLFGFAGMIIAVPLFAVIYDIVKRLVYLGLCRRGRQDLIEEYGQLSGAVKDAPRSKEEQDAGM